MSQPLFALNAQAPAFQSNGFEHLDPASDIVYSPILAQLLDPQLFRPFSECCDILANHLTNAEWLTLYEVFRSAVLKDYSDRFHARLVVEGAAGRIAYMKANRGGVPQSLQDLTALEWAYLGLGNMEARRRIQYDPARLQEAYDHRNSYEVFFPYPNIMNLHAFYVMTNIFEDDSRRRSLFLQWEPILEFTYGLTANDLRERMNNTEQQLVKGSETWRMMRHTHAEEIVQRAVNFMALGEEMAAVECAQTVAVLPQ